MYAITDLETFAEVARLGGIAAAARFQGISAATASHRVAKLEHALNLTLFHRNSRSFSVTDEGQIFLERVETILEDLHQAELDAGGGKTTLRGHLRVTLSPWILSRFILPRLQTFSDAHPDLSIEFLAADRYVSIVEEGQDCAIRIGQLEDSTLIAKKICDNDRLIAAAPDFLERFGVPKTLADLEGLTWICLPWLRRWSIKVPGKKQSHISAKRTLLVSSSESMREAVVQGLGLAVKSRLAVKAELETGRLVEILPGTLSPAEAPIWYMTSPDARTGRKTKAFGSFVETAFQ